MGVILDDVSELKVTIPTSDVFDLREARGGSALVCITSSLFVIGITYMLPRFPYVCEG